MKSSDFDSSVDTSGPRYEIYILHVLERVFFCRFLGIMMGLAIRSGSPLGLSIAEPMWKLLAGSRLTPGDITEVGFKF